MKFEYIDRCVCEFKSVNNIEGVLQAGQRKGYKIVKKIE